MTTVFYNSACPVCDAGINAQKEKMTSCDVEWVDVHKNPDAVDELGTDLEFVRERLHVVDKAGRVSVGASAFAVLLANTPSQRIWAKLIRLPVMEAFSNTIYNLFSRALYRWNRSRKHW